MPPSRTPASERSLSDARQKLPYTPPPLPPPYDSSNTSTGSSRDSSVLTELPSSSRSYLSELTPFASSDEDAEGEDDSDYVNDKGRVLLQPRAKLTRSRNSLASLNPISPQKPVKNGKTLSTPRGKTTLKYIIVDGVELKPTVAFDTFWRFAAERKAIDDRRRAGQPAPWTEDPILQKYFFCNTFRVLDKVCQYLIEHVIEKGSQEPIEVVFRVTLFNTFTKISTWERLQSELGPLTWASYNREKYIAVLDQLRSENQALYTAAFIKPAPHFGFKENHINHLCLLENLMENEMPYKLLGAKTMADVYEYLISFPGMGDFTTYQLMLNLSYTNVLNFHRNDFTIAGLGAISGLNKMFGRSFSEAYADDKGFAEQVLRYLAEAQDEHFQRLGLEFSGLGPEKLGMDLSDIEHTVCEVDKYCRKAHPQLKAKRMTIKHEYKPVTTPSGIPVPYPKEPILPKAWSHPARKIPNVRPGPLTIEKRYEVDKLTDDKVDEQGRRLFFVHWVGYSLKDATWEFEQSLLQDAPRVVHEYMAAKTAGKQKNANKRRKLK